MSFAVSAQQLNTAHSKTGIRPLNDIGFGQFRVKTGPAATGNELTSRAKQGVITANAMILSVILVLIVLASLKIR